MRNRIGFYLGITMIVICFIILFSSCTTQKVATKTKIYTAKDSTISYQRIIVDSVGTIWVLPSLIGLKK